VHVAKIKIAVTALLVAGMMWQSTSPTAAPDNEWLKLFVTANGGCQNRDIFAVYHVQHIQTEVARNNFNTALFGKPILKWTDDDIETALRVFRDCEMKITAPKIAACMRTGQRQSFCETYGIDLKTPVRQFERYLRDTVTMARARYAQQEAQRKAKIEQEKIDEDHVAPPKNSQGALNEQETALLVAKITLYDSECAPISDALKKVIEAMSGTISKPKILDEIYKLDAFIRQPGNKASFAGP
jgi:hypothetical protein